MENLKKEIEQLKQEKFLVFYNFCDYLIIFEKSIEK